MIRSMTGYGRAEITFRGEKITIEIRSLNGKSADIYLKSALIPKSKEPEVRQLITSQLQRGTIDLYINMEANPTVDRPINRERFMACYKEIRALQNELPELGHQENLLSAILRIPEVMEHKNQEPDESLWMAIWEGINLSINQVNLFRTTEGEELSRDILQRVALIESYINKVEGYESARMDVVKERLLSRLKEFEGTVHPDQNRFEQELIYYLEKLDITEEKVRLRQHCAFFRECVINEHNQGRKLSFITQEMGREMNTIGSKANHAAMQQNVVMMKDELEKIKEQIMNIL